MEVIPTKDGGYDIEAMIHREAKTHDYVALLFHVDEVLTLRPDLSREQALEVLDAFNMNREIIAAAFKHDMISDLSDEMFPTQGGAPELHHDQAAHSLQPAGIDIT